MRINILLIIIWLEVNVLGRTILPEIYFFIVFNSYIFLYSLKEVLCLKLMLKTRKITKVMGNI